MGSDQQWCTRCHSTDHDTSECTWPPPHAKASSEYVSKIAHSSLLSPGQMLIGDLHHGARVYEPVPRWWQRTHRWRLGRLHIEIRWAKKS